MSAVQHLDPKDFDKVIQDPRVLIMLSTPFCHPCKSVVMQLDKREDSFRGVAKIYKVDATELNDVCTKHSVCRVPSFLMYDNGILKGVDTNFNTNGDVPSKLHAFIEKSMKEETPKTEEVSFDITL